MWKNPSLMQNRPGIIIKFCNLKKKTKIKNKTTFINVYTLSIITVQIPDQKS